MMKANNIYVDSKFLYIILDNKIDIYDKITRVKFNTVKIKNASIIISDIEKDKIFINTTNGIFYVFSLNEFAVILEVKFNSEVFEMVYDKNKGYIYVPCIDIKNKKSIIYKINILNNQFDLYILDDYVSVEILEVKNDTIILLCKNIDVSLNDIILYEYDKEKFNIISKKIKNTKLNDLKKLDRNICYNNYDGFENIYSGEVTYFKDIGLVDNPYILLKKKQNFYFISNYKCAYLLSNDFRVYKKFIENNMKNAITDVEIDDENIFIIKGNNLYIDKIEL